MENESGDTLLCAGGSSLKELKVWLVASSIIDYITFFF